MRAVYLLAATLGLSVASTNPLASQTPVCVPSIGSRLRVSTRADEPTRLVGSIVRMTNDSVTLRDARGVEHAVSLADAGQIEISRGKVGHPNLGAGIGVGVGILAGGVYGSLSFSDAGYTSCADFVCDRPTREASVLGGAVLGALIGGGIGALIGTDIKTDRWMTIGASSFKPTASVRPTVNGGAVVSLALPF